jgi:hypothetical protein
MAGFEVTVGGILQLAKNSRICLPRWGGGLEGQLKSRLYWQPLVHFAIFKLARYRKTSFRVKAEALVCGLARNWSDAHQ